MSFPFPQSPPPSNPISLRTPKPMQWPNGAELEKDDWEFFPEAIKSWRAWRITHHEVEPDQGMDKNVILLQSITYRTVWIPKQEMIAECKPMALVTEDPTSIPKQPVHSSPDLTHGCGIYSVKTEEQALEWRRYRFNDPVVWGQVNIWGHVYKFTKGYLSEFAYPARIFVPDDLASWKNLITPEMLALELTQTYGIEAVTT